MTTTRFVIRRIALECDGASVTIASIRDEWADREQLCVEIVTTDAATGDEETDHDDTPLAPYCSRPAPVERTRRRRPAGSRRRHRALVAAAAVAALALVATVIAARPHPASDSSASAAPTSGPVDPSPASRNDATPTDVLDGAPDAIPAELAGRCAQMISSASSALGIDDESLVRSLVADHEGETLNRAVHQELSDARAVLVSRAGRADAAPPAAATDVGALDTAIADADATPCSAPDESPPRQ